MSIHTTARQFARFIFLDQVTSGAPHPEQNASTVESLEILAGTVAPEATPAPSATEAPVVTSAPVAPPVGDTLTSPPELEWTLNEATGVFSGEIEMGVVTMDNFFGRTTTRGFNGQVCVFCQLPFSTSLSLCLQSPFRLAAGVFAGEKIVRIGCGCLPDGGVAHFFSEGYRTAQSMAAVDEATSSVYISLASTSRSESTPTPKKLSPRETLKWYLVLSCLVLHRFVLSCVASPCHGLAWLGWGWLNSATSELKVGHSALQRTTVRH